FYGGKKQIVRDAYNSARGMSGNDALLDGVNFSESVFLELDDKALKSFLPPDIKKIVKQIGNNPEYFTLKKGEELIKVLNSHYKASLNPIGEPTATTHALGVVRDSLKSIQDDAIDVLAGSGNDAAIAYQNARMLYKDLASLKAKMPLLQDVLKQQAKGSLNYDDLYKKHILGGKVEELSQTIEVLKNTNPQAVADIQQEVIKDIAGKAINSNGQFSPAGMK